MALLRKINNLPRTEKEGLYRILIPPSLFRRFGIDPVFLCDKTGSKAGRFFCPRGDGTCLVEINLPENEDPLYSIQLSDSPDRTQIDWDFLIVNDPGSPKFKTDVDEQGRDTLFGWASRNLEEEEQAMRAGLFPGQVRKGLGLTAEAINVLDFFCRIFNIKSIRLESLFYHNAITYERHGFSYFTQYKQMKKIHDFFQPGDKLFKKLDGSTPFRQPGFAQTVWGRSWAIHDGILNEIEDDLFEEGWVSPVMYRMVENPRCMVTFPNPKY